MHAIRYGALDALIALSTAVGGGAPALAADAGWHVPACGGRGSMCLAPYGADRATEDRSHLGLGQILVVAKDDHRSLPISEPS